MAIIRLQTMRGGEIVLIMANIQYLDQLAIFQILHRLIFLPSRLIRGRALIVQEQQIPVLVMFMNQMARITKLWR